MEMARAEMRNCWRWPPLQASASLASSLPMLAVCLPVVASPPATLDLCAVSIGNVRVRHETTRARKTRRDATRHTVRERTLWRLSATWLMEASSEVALGAEAWASISRSPMSELIDADDEAGDMAAVRLLLSVAILHDDTTRTQHTRHTTHDTSDRQPHAQ